MKNKWAPVLAAFIAFAFCLSNQAFGGCEIVRTSTPLITDKLVGVRPESDALAERDIKTIVRGIYRQYQEGRDEVPSEFSILLRFQVKHAGFLNLSSLELIRSSGSRMIDLAAIELLSKAGQAHLLGLLGPAGGDSVLVEFRLTKDEVTLSLREPVDSLEDAKVKSRQFNFLFGILKFSQRAKNPELSRLLDKTHVTIVDGNLVEEIRVPHACAGELLRRWLGEPVKDIDRSKCERTPTPIDIHHLIAG